MLSSRRDLCTRVLKRCRRLNVEQQQQKTCASTCSMTGCGLRAQQPDLVCCQWANLPIGAISTADKPLNITIHHSQRRQEQQQELFTTWKQAMEQSAVIRRDEAERQARLSQQRETAVQDKECQLPMDMECGCKTKREKEEQERRVLAEAREKQAMQVAPQLQLQVEQRPVSTSKPSISVINSSTPAVKVTSSKPQQMQMSFHRRHLPHECIAFSSAEGRKLFVEALNSPKNYMQIYFPLAEQFITQAEPAYCGLSTLAMCLNALQIDPGRLWKGPWRWFSEELFDCCTSLSVAKEKGISMSEFICLARCNGVMTKDYRANDEFTLDQFREVVKKSCSTNDEIIVLNYSRKALGQTGDGHFSPIGGYHEELDMVLLLDVARFKYPPHWVKLSLVHDAMQRVDQSSGLPRGLVVLKENAHATGPTLVKNMILSADPSTPLKPAPQPCCSSVTALEARRVVEMQ
ncbi:hypothetical protein ATCC90586_008448 [Pythium insidiosum]|nr:hypothetical protein ATCC90586_008448 [Pythium insidiosum]